MTIFFPAHCYSIAATTISPSILGFNERNKRPLCNLFWKFRIHLNLDILKMNLTFFFNCFVYSKKALALIPFRLIYDQNKFGFSSLVQANSILCIPCKFRKIYLKHHPTIQHKSTKQWKFNIKILFIDLPHKNGEKWNFLERVFKSAFYLAAVWFPD